MSDFLLSLLRGAWSRWTGGYPEPETGEDEECELDLVVWLQAPYWMAMSADGGEVSPERLYVALAMLEARGGGSILLCREDPER